LCVKRAPLTPAEIANEYPSIIFTQKFSSLITTNIDIIGLYNEEPDMKLEMMLEALKNGIHVIVEYPLVFNIEQARRLNSEMECLTGQLRVVQITQVIPNFIHQQKEFVKGSIGDLELLEVHFTGWNYIDTNREHRPIIALSNVVTMIRCFIKRIESVEAYSRVSHEAKSHSSTIDDIYVINFLSKTGEIAKATVNCCQSIPVQEKLISCKLYGTKGISQATYPDMIYEQYNPNSEPIKHEFLIQENLEFYFNQKEKDLTSGSIIPYGCYANYFNHFARYIVSQQIDKIKLNIIQGIQTVVIVEAIRRSALEKRSVRIKEIRTEIFGQ